MGNVMTGGKWEFIINYDRGPMILYSEQEWKDRVRSVNKGFAIVQFVLGIMILVLNWLTFYLLWLVHPETGSYFLPLWVLLSAILLVIALAAAPIKNRRDSRNPTQGLYERGIQYWSNYFVPYDELERVDRRMRRSLLWRGSIMLRSRHRPTVWSFNGSPWLIKRKFLGDEGIEEIITRIDDTY